MANTTSTTTANSSDKLAAVMEYGKDFMKARKGEIKLHCSDIEKLSDLFEVFFGQRISNKADRISQQAWVDKKNYRSELIVKDTTGAIYKVYTQVAPDAIKSQLG
jgi:hypothetical protein